MALIELNLEKPALKQVENTESEAPQSTEDTEDEKPSKTETSTGARPGRGKAVAATLVVGLLGVITFRKLRARRRTDE